MKKKIKTLRTDNGTEFINQNFLNFTNSKGIIHQTDKSKSHIYSDRIWYLKLYHFTLFMHILVQLVDLVWILHKVRDTAIVSLISGLLEHFGNIWMKME
jgi:hypothetical protein